MEYIEVLEKDIDHHAILKMDPYLLIENDLLLLQKHDDDFTPLVSSAQVTDVIIQKCELFLGHKTKLFISEESVIDRLQHKILFEHLSHKEFKQLKSTLKQKMLPKSILPQILEYRQQSNNDFIASCQHFGFLPDDQLQRVSV